MKFLINIFGAPKSGKTTLMSAIFLSLKMNDIYCEMVSDYPKGVLFEHRKDVLTDQLHIFSVQTRRIEEIYRYADVTITDCPILHSLIYNADKFKTLHPYIIEKHNSFNNLNLFIKQKKEVKYGSFKLMTVEEIKQKEVEIENMLKEYPHLEYPQEPTSIRKAIKDVFENLNSTQKWRVL